MERSRSHAAQCGQFWWSRYLFGLERRLIVLWVALRFNVGFRGYSCGAAAQLGDGGQYAGVMVWGFCFVGIWYLGCFVMGSGAGPSMGPADTRWRDEV